MNPTVVDAGRLRDVLLTLAAHVNEKSLVPAYTAVRLEIIQGMLMATAGSQPCLLTIQVAPVEGEWSICPQIKPLSSFLSTLPTQPIRLEVADKKLTVHYQLGAKWNFVTFPAFAGKDYPTPKTDHGTKVPIASSLAGPLRKLLSFCKNEPEFFPAQSGIWFDVLPTSIGLIGFDGRFIAEEIIDHDSELKGLHQFIVPYWGVTALSDVLKLANYDDKLELSLGESWLTLWFPGAAIQIQRVEADRPKFEDLWGDDGATYTVDRRELVASIRRIKTIPHQGTDFIGFYPGLDEVTLKGAFSDYQFEEGLTVEEAGQEDRKQASQVKPFGLEPIKFETSLKFFEGERQSITVTNRRAVLLQSNEEKRRILFMPQDISNA
ncbi:hypothetical protein [Tellurirhabdus bombi]|uniref:hypothetical protein n=1 Tax=Tellurirhabdus bombi TaxID=2907205 RepID=UPI001F34CA7D|nr:hypothetical protein [Tellurirhabdus bombi]